MTIKTYDNELHLYHKINTTVSKIIKGLVQNPTHKKSRIKAKVLKSKI